MKQAFFDFSGTVIDCSGKTKVHFIPMMPEILKRMEDDNWRVTLVSRYTESQCRQLLTSAGSNLEYPIASSAGSSKGEVVSNLLSRDGEAVFVDDKPENLASVRKLCGNRVRVIGFVGSRKYTPVISTWCRQNEIELSLSPVDLCEGLKINVDMQAAFYKSKSPRSMEELASLIPGLDHPMSALSGETCFCDHRYPLSQFLERCMPDDHPLLWSNLGWITCNECLWKALVRSVLLCEGINPDDVLGEAYKHFEYTEALLEFGRTSEAKGIHKVFMNALTVMENGIRSIGIDAEACRIGNRGIETDRIAQVCKRIDAFGNAVHPGHSTPTGLE